MTNRVIVTGANGFIGSHLIAELIESQIPVIAIVRSNSNVEILKKHKCYNILRTSNYLDPSFIRQISISKPNYIVHCGWQDLDENKSLSLINNMKLLLDALELSKRINCNGFISIGSYEEYGTIKNIANEEYATKPITSFGKIKLATSLTSINFCNNNNMIGCHVRLSMPYNSRNTNTWNIPSIINNFSKGENPKILNASQYIDYIHVSDIARGIISLIKAKTGGVYNLASGKSEQIKRLVNMIKNELNSDIIPQFKDEEIYSDFRINIDKIINKSGWKPSISIWEGISMIIQEEKFSKNPSLSEFSKRIRELCKSSIN